MNEYLSLSCLTLYPITSITISLFVIGAVYLLMFSSANHCLRPAGKAFRVLCSPKEHVCCSFFAIKKRLYFFPRWPINLQTSVFSPLRNTSVLAHFLKSKWKLVLPAGVIWIQCKNLTANKFS